MAMQYKTALVTGASHRIGAAIAQDLASNGFNVAVHFSSSAQAAEKLVEAMRDEGLKAKAFQGDLTKTKNCRDLFDRCAEDLGPIDLLVNNASIFEPDFADQFDEEQWDQHFAIHTKAPVILGGKLKQQPALRNGMIVNIIDERVERLNPMYFSYTLSKSALWTATKTMAQQFAPAIRVNAIGPGPTLANKRQTNEDFKRQVKSLPLETAPKLSEFGSTVRYLYETPSITGQMIMLDGGQHLAWQTPDLAGPE